MDNNATDLLNEAELGVQNIEFRKKLLPWWVKTFAWIFLIMGGMAVICIVAGFFVDGITFSLYGLESSESLSPLWLCILMLFLLKGITAYGLLSEKKWAVQLAMVDAIVGIIVCMFTMFIPIGETSVGRVSLRLELILLIPYLIRMNKIRAEWMMREAGSNW